jgi:hypothetical protein
MLLEGKDPVHMEIISTEEEINRIVKLLECTYLFKYFSVVPLKEKE